MPRKKTVQPPPLKVFDLGNGNSAVYRDHTCREIGRGLHNKDEFEDKCGEILQLVANDYLKIDPTDPKRCRYKYQRPKGESAHYLKNASAFARKCQFWGFGGEDGADDSALRKRVYKEVRSMILAYKRALEKKHGYTPEPW